MKSTASVFTLLSAFYFLNTISAYADEEIIPQGVCEYLAKTASTANAKISRKTINGDKSAPFVKNYLVQEVLWSASQNQSPLVVNKDTFGHNKEDGHELYEDYVRWSHDSGFLPYLGEWYKVLSRTDYGASRNAQSSGAYPSALLGKEGLVCAFDVKTIEYPEPTLDNFRLNSQNGKPLDCNKAVAPENKILPSISLPEENWEALKEQLSEDLYPGRFIRSAYLWSPFLDGESMPRTKGPVIRVDINNDGQQENLLGINYSESGGAFCDTKYYDLINENMDSAVHSDLREALLKAQGISRDKKGHLQYACWTSNHINVVDGQMTISTQRKLQNHISLILDDKATKLCTSKFTIEPRIRFDASINEHNK